MAWIYVTGTYRWTRCADESDVGSGKQLPPCPACDNDER
jgi:hypothetical protein